MSDIQLTLACEDYDRTRPLRDGSVKPEGVAINYLVLPVEEIFWRMMRYEEFDVAELSMGAFLVASPPVSGLGEEKTFRLRRGLISLRCQLLWAWR